MNEMKGCPESEILAAWIEGSLGPTGRAAVRGHLADCDGCRRAVALAGTLGPAPAGGAGPGGATLLAERAAREARRGRFRRAGALAAAAAAALAAVALAVGRSPEQVSPSVPRPESPPFAAAEDPAAPPAVPPPRLVIRPSQVPPPAAEEPPAPARPEASRPVQAGREELQAVPAPAPPPAAPPGRTAGPTPPPADANPGPTIAVLREAHGAVLLADVTGNLRIARGESEPSVPQAYARADGRDTLAALSAGAGFSVDGRATLALGPGARASVFRFEADRSYGLHLAEGAALVDTEGATMRWKVSRGRAELTFVALNGRIALEGRGAEDLAVTLLEGRGELKEAGAGPRIGSGREWFCDPAGRWAERPADPRKWKALAALLPGQLTLFEATFEEAGKVRPFPYTILSGRAEREGERCYLAAAPGGEAGPARTAVIRPEPAIPYVTGLRLRIRCRADASEVIIRLGEFRAAVPLPRRGAWVDVEAALDDFLHEGVRMVPSDVVTDVRVSLPEGRRDGILHVDAVSFFRRTR